MEGYIAGCQKRGVLVASDVAAYFGGARFTDGNAPRRLPPLNLKSPRSNSGATWRAPELAAIVDALVMLPPRLMPLSIDCSGTHLPAETLDRLLTCWPPRDGTDDGEDATEARLFLNASDISSTHLNVLAAHVAGSGGADPNAAAVSSLRTWISQGFSVVIDLSDNDLSGQVNSAALASLAAALTWTPSIELPADPMSPTRPAAVTRAPIAIRLNRCRLAQAADASVHGDALGSLALSVDTLALQGNRLGETNIFDTVFCPLYLVNSTLLTRLDVSRCHLGDRGARALVAALLKNPFIEAVNARENGFTDGGIAAFGEVALHCSNVSELAIGGHACDANTTLNLLLAIGGSVSLKYVDIEGLSIDGAQAVSAVFDVLEYTARLRLLVVTPPSSLSSRDGGAAKGGGKAAAANAFASQVDLIQQRRIAAGMQPVTVRHSFEAPAVSISSAPPSESAAARSIMPPPAPTTQVQSRHANTAHELSDAQRTAILDARQAGLADIERMLNAESNRVAADAAKLTGEKEALASERATFERKCAELDKTHDVWEQQYRLRVAAIANREEELALQETTVSNTRASLEEDYATRRLLLAKDFAATEAKYVHEIALWKRRAENAETELAALRKQLRFALTRSALEAKRSAPARQVVAVNDGQAEDDYEDDAFEVLVETEEVPPPPPPTAATPKSRAEPKPTELTPEPTPTSQHLTDADIQEIRERHAEAVRRKLADDRSDGPRLNQHQARHRAPVASGAAERDAGAKRYLRTPPLTDDDEPTPQSTPPRPYGDKAEASHPTAALPANPPSQTEPPRQEQLPTARAPAAELAPSEAGTSAPAPTVVVEPEPVEDRSATPQPEPVAPTVVVTPPPAAPERQEPASPPPAQQITTTVPTTPPPAVSNTHAPDAATPTNAVTPSPESLLTLPRTEVLLHYPDFAAAYASLSLAERDAFDDAYDDAHRRSRQFAAPGLGSSGSTDDVQLNALLRTLNQCIRNGLFVRRCQSGTAAKHEQSALDLATTPRLDRDIVSMTPRRSSPPRPEAQAASLRSASMAAGPNDLHALLASPFDEVVAKHSETVRSLRGHHAIEALFAQWWSSTESDASDFAADPKMALKSPARRAEPGAANRAATRGVSPDPGARHDARLRHLAWLWSTDSTAPSKLHDGGNGISAAPPRLQGRGGPAGHHLDAASRSASGAVMKAEQRKVVSDLLHQVLHN